MKLVWSPEIASKAYIDTVKSCEPIKESGVSEMVSAMAAGWNAKLVVETWSPRGGSIATSIGLSVATHHTGGRHICIVPDQESKAAYKQAMIQSGHSVVPEIIVAESQEAAVEGLDGIDFLVMDCRGDDFASILRVAKLGERGAVLICKNASSRAASDSRWRSMLDSKSRIVRSVFLPVGEGLDIAHVGAQYPGGSSGKGKVTGGRRWIKHFDHESGEEYVIRK